MCLVALDAAALTAALELSARLVAAVEDRNFQAEWAVELWAPASVMTELAHREAISRGVQPRPLSAAEAVDASLACASVVASHLKEGNRERPTVVALDAGRFGLSPASASEVDGAVGLVDWFETFGEHSGSATAALLPWRDDAREGNVAWWRSDLSAVALRSRPGRGAGVWIRELVEILDDRRRLLERVDPAQLSVLMTLYGAVAPREAWWRVQENGMHVELGVFAPPGLTDARAARRADSAKSNKGPVPRYLSGDAALQDVAAWSRLRRTMELFADGAARALERVCGRARARPAPRHGAVVLTGADARVASDAPPVRAVAAGELKGQPTNAQHDAIVAQFGAAKLRWAKTHGYDFDFFVTNSLADALTDVGLRHWEFGKAFMLMAAAHGTAARALHTQRPRAPNWLAWLDHDTWPHPTYAFDDRLGSLDAYLDQVPEDVPLALSNFRSLNTGILFVRLNRAGRALLLEWLGVTAANRVQCQPYDQAALQLLLFSRLNGTDPLDPALRPFGYSCEAPACGGTVEKPFGMCNPKYAKATARFVEESGFKVCDASRKIPPPKDCADRIDRGNANALVNRAGFHVLKQSRDLPRVQCFDASSLEDCPPNPGANFPPDHGEHPGWLFSHKGQHLFYANYANDSNPPDCGHLRRT